MCSELQDLSCTGVNLLEIKGCREYFAENNWISPKQTEQVSVRNQSPGKYCHRGCSPDLSFHMLTVAHSRDDALVV